MQSHALVSGTIDCDGENLFLFVLQERFRLRLYDDHACGAVAIWQVCLSYKKEDGSKGESLVGWLTGVRTKSSLDGRPIEHGVVSTHLSTAYANARAIHQGRYDAVLTRPLEDE
jgi:hypothetical protein